MPTSAPEGPRGEREMRQLLLATQNVKELAARPEGANALVDLTNILLRRSGAAEIDPIPTFATILNAEAAGDGSEHEFLNGNHMMDEEEGFSQDFLHRLVGFLMAVGFINLLPSDLLAIDITTNIEKIKREGIILVGDYASDTRLHSQYLREIAERRAPTLLDAARDFSDEFSQRTGLAEEDASTLRTNAVQAAIQIYARIGGFDFQPAIIGAIPEIPPPDPDEAQVAVPSGRSRKPAGTR